MIGAMPFSTQRSPISVRLVFTLEQTSVIVQGYRTGLSSNNETSRTTESSKTTIV